MNSEPNKDDVTLARRFLIAVVARVCRFPRTTLVLSFLLAAASLYAACFHLEYHTSRNDLISPKKDYQQRWNRYLAEFGADDDMVVVVRGTDRDKMTASLDAVASQIEKHPDLFEKLFYKVDLRPLRRRALLMIDLEDIRAIDANLDDMKMLLELGPISWSGLGLTSLLGEAQSRIRRLNPGKPLSASDKLFFQQFLAVCREAKQTLEDPKQYSNPWGSLLAPSDGSGAFDATQMQMLDEVQYFFSGDGTLAFLLVRPVKEEGSFTAARKSVETMRGLLASVRDEHPDVEIGLTGMPVLETDEMVAAETDTRMASWLAIGGVCLLYLVVYRGIRYPLVTVVTLLIGTAWAMGFATLTVGHLNILSATFAVMLIGMGDYGVLWAMRYEQARQRGEEVMPALLHTTEFVAIGNLTAAGTLALAFFMAMFADFKAVAELGWIAGCGVMLCAFACFTVFPAWMMLTDRREFSAEADDAEMKASPTSLRLFDGKTAPPDRGWLVWLWPHSRWVLAATVVLTLGLGWAATRVRYDHNLLHLQAEDLESVRWELTLIEHTAGASWHAVSYTRTREEALALKKKYEQLPEVSRVVEVASLVPLEQHRKTKVLRRIQKRLERLPKRGSEIPHLTPDSKLIETNLEKLLTSLDTDEKKWNVAHSTSSNSVSDVQTMLARLRTTASELQTQLETMPESVDVGTRLKEFDVRLSSDLAENLHLLRDVSNPDLIYVEDLPADLRARHIGKSGTWLLRVFARDGLWEFEPLQHFANTIRSVDDEATGKPFGTVEGLKAMKDGLIRAGVYAFAMIALLLWLDFRSTKKTLLALLPLVLGVLFSLGVMGLLGLPLNPANMIAFPLILGVGVDNGVHLLHDYKLRLRDGKARTSLISHAIGRGVFVKALTTMIGFGSLMISTERGLASLGFLLAMGVGCAMVAALIVLPAVLTVGHAWRERRSQPTIEPTPQRGTGMGVGNIVKVAA